MFVYVVRFVRCFALFRLLSFLSGFVYYVLPEPFLMLPASCPLHARASTPLLHLAVLSLCMYGFREHFDVALDSACLYDVRVVGAFLPRNDIDSDAYDIHARTCEGSIKLR